MLKTARPAGILLLLSVCAGAQPGIPLVVDAAAGEVERFAAEELSTHLRRLYPDQDFPVVSSAPQGAKRILLGTADAQALGRWRQDPHLKKPESFLVTVVREANAETAVVAGADARGVLYAVYALLEKLGFGFYLSYNTEPPPRRGPVRFDEWDLADAPLFPDRMALNWHNFLSGASAWDLADWQHWIGQLARMRYNTIAVHAYGNNPMFTYSFRGKAKPAGYLSSTHKGRDWGTQHVNDVRRMFGGELFDGPVFASAAALVPDEERVAAATGLMQRVFRFARSRGMHVSFAFDVETEFATPQELILELPAHARFTGGRLQLADPDTAEGYEFYKTQASALLRTYPEIDRLVVFFRDKGTPWSAIRLRDFPASWKERFADEVRKNPRLGGDRRAPQMFAISRIIAAFDRALGELGRTDVELATATFRHEHLPAADALFPARTTLYMLDWWEIFESESFRALSRSIAAHRKVAPFMYVTHDDWSYVGRPHAPFPGFASLLDSAGASGFGALHWTMRPNDLYFKSLADQVWESSRNRPLAGTCEEMAIRSFGETARETGGEYLRRWVTEGPAFGRETTDRFMDLLLEAPAAAIAKCRERIALLDRIGEGRLSADEKRRLGYYRNLELFSIAFLQSEGAYQEALILAEKGQYEKARQALAKSKPEEVIEQFARMSSAAGVNKGDQGLVVSMNLRWLPYIVSLRQALGMEPVRIKYRATHHEAVAHQPGSHTFYFDGQRKIWKALGEKELNHPVFSGEGTSEELCRSGIRIERTANLKLAPIMGDRLAPGTYTAHLVFIADPESGTYAPVRFRGLASAVPAAVKRLEMPPGRQVVRIGSTLEVTAGALEVNIDPQLGKVHLCGAILEPAGGAPASAP